MTGQVVRTLGLALALGCGAPAPPPVTPVASAEAPPRPPPRVVVTDEEPALPIARAVTEPAGPEPVFQRVHRRAIVEVVESPDGRSLATLSGEGTVAVVDARTGETRASRRVWIRRGARTLAFDATGTRLVMPSSREPAGVIVWDLAEDRLHVHAAAHGVFAPSLAAASPDGASLAVVEDAPNGAVLRWLDLGTLEERSAVELGATRAISLSWSPSGRRLLLRDEAGGLELRDAHGGGIVAQRDAQEGRALGPAAFRPSGGALAVPVSDGTVEILDPATGESRHVVRLPWDQGDAPLGEVRAEVAWSPDGGRLLVRRAAELHVLEGRTLVPLAALALAPEGAPPIVDLRASPAGDVLYVRDAEGGLSRRDGTTGDDLGRLVISPARVDGPFTVSRDGRQLAVASGATLRLLDAASGEVRASLEGEAGEHSVWGVVWQPDSRGFVSWGRGGVEVWSGAGPRTTACAGTGEVTWDASGVGRYFQGGAVCPLDGGAPRPAPRMLAHTRSGAHYAVREPDAITVHDAASGEPYGRPLRVPTDVRCYGGGCFGLSDDARIAALAVGEEVHVFDTRTGRVRARARPGERVRRVTLAPDGGTVLVETARGAVLCSTRTGRAVLSLDAEIASPVFSADSRTLAYLAEGQVSLVSPSRGRVRGAIAVASPTRLELSADGSTVLVPTTDGTVLLAAAEDGASRGRVAAPGGAPSVSADGARLAACVEGELRLRDVDASTTSVVGLCAPGDRLALSPDGAFLAVVSGAVVTAWRLSDQRWLRARTLRLEGRAVALAHDAEGAWTSSGHLEADLRHRAQGSLLEAALHHPGAGPAASGTLIDDFFGGR